MQPSGGSQVLLCHVALVQRGQETILDFVELSAADADESGKLAVALAPESLGHIPADGISRVIEL